MAMPPLQSGDETRQKAQQIDQYSQLLEAMKSGDKERLEKLLGDDRNRAYLVRNLLSNIKNAIKTKKDASLDLNLISTPSLLAGIINTINGYHSEYEEIRGVYASILKDIFEIIVAKNGENALTQVLIDLQNLSGFNGNLIARLPEFVLYAPYGNTVDPKIFEIILNYIKSVSSKNKVNINKSIINNAFIDFTYTRMILRATLTPEQIAEEEHKTEKIFAILLQNGADVNARYFQGNAALIFAVKKRNFKIAELLLKNNAKVDAQDKDGFTALMIAAKKGHIETVELLLRNGAGVNVNVNVKNATTSALIEAAKGGHTETVRLLLEKGGADPSIKDTNGHNASYYNCSNFKQKKENRITYYFKYFATKREIQRLLSKAELSFKLGKKKQEVVSKPTLPLPLSPRAKGLIYRFKKFQQPTLAGEKNKKTDKKSDQHQLPSHSGLNKGYKRF